MTTANQAIDSSTFVEESMSKIGKDVIKYAPSKIFGMLANLFLVPLYTNLLLPSEYGLYNIAISVLSFICILFSDWIGVAGLRFFKKHDNEGNIESYFTTLLLLLVFNITLMFISGYFFYNDIVKFFKIPGNLLYFVFLLIIPVAFRALLFQVLRAQIKPLSYTFSVILNQVTTIGFSVYFIKFWNMGSIALLLGMAFSITLIDLLMMHQSKMGRFLNLKTIKHDIFSDFYKYGAPIAASSLGTWMITQSNRFVLMHYKGPEFNGLSGVGFNLTYSMILPLFSILTLAAIPRIINQQESGTNVKPIISKLTGYYFALFTPIIMLLCLFPNEIVMLFSNKNYSNASIIVPYLAVSVFILGLTEYTTIQYHLARRTYIDTIIRLIPGVIGLALNIILIPKFGLIGVGIPILISNSIYLLLSMFISIKKYSWNPPVEMMKTVILATSISTIVYFIMKNLFINVATINSFFIQAIYIISAYLMAFYFLRKKYNVN